MYLKLPSLSLLFIRFDYFSTLFQDKQKEKPEAITLYPQRAIYKNRHMYPVSYVIIQSKLIYGSSRRKTKKIISFKKSSPPQPLYNHFPSIHPIQPNPFAIKYKEKYIFFHMYGVWAGECIRSIIKII